jgi:hypothetical protein
MIEKLMPEATTDADILAGYIVPAATQKSRIMTS